MLALCISGFDIMCSHYDDSIMVFLDLSKQTCGVVDTCHVLEIILSQFSRWIR